MVSYRHDEATECVICEGEIPEGRHLTCSHDCYIEYKYRKEKDQRIADGKFKRRPLVCEYCQMQFRPKYSPQTRQGMHIIHYKPKFCSSACKENHVKLQRRLASQVLEKYLGPK